MHLDATLVISEGKFVVMHWYASGTHTEALATPNGGIIVSTDRKAGAAGCSTLEIVNDKITRAWVVWDMASLLAQRGLLSTV